MITAWVDGFAAVIEPFNLGMLLVGTLFGMVLGIIPGIGPIQGMAILLPLTVLLDPVPALILLGGVFSGGMYGGQVTSILLGTPGDAAHAMAVLDGYPMTKRGEGGVALGAATAASLGSAYAGLLVLSFAAPPLAKIAVRFGPPEYLLLSVLGLMLVALAVRGDVVKGLISAGIGMLLGTIGYSPILGVPRLTFGMSQLEGGISFVVLTIGVFAIAELLELIESTAGVSHTGRLSGGIRAGMRSVVKYRGTYLRSTGIGVGLGLLPGVGATTATMLSYLSASRWGKDRANLGKGSVEGVIAAETADNAVVGTSLVPTLTLGIPGSATAAMLLGALTIQGVFPGPRLFETNKALVYAFFASLFVAQLVWFVVGLSLTNVFARLSTIRVEYLVPMVLAICTVAVYVENRRVSDVILMLLLGCAAYVLRKAGYSPVPLIIAFILSPIAEESFHQTSAMARGSWSLIVERPYSRAILIAFIGVAFTFLSRHFRSRPVSADKRTPELDIVE